MATVNKKTTAKTTLLRIVSILAVISLVLGVFAGCSKNIEDTPETTTSASDVTGNDNSAVTDDRTDDTTDNSQSSEWNYDFDSAFITDNAISYVWERLDENTRIALGEVMNAIRNCQVFVPLSVGIPYDERTDFLSLVSNCCTMYSWVNTSFKVTTDPNDETTIISIQVNYRIDYPEEAEEMISSTEAALAEIVAGMPDGTEYEKLLYLHDYLVLSCEYSDTAGSYPFSAYGALVEKYATCQGYADAMHLILDRAGFETMFTIGVGSNEAVTHKWNYVKCENGEWYIIDTTWDDPADMSDYYFLSYNYFLISDEEILKDHQAKHSSIYYDPPVATSMDLCYFDCMGYYAETADEAYEILMAQATSTIDTELRCLYIKFPDSETMRAIYDELKNDGRAQEILKAASDYTNGFYKSSTWTRVYNDDLGTLILLLVEQD